MRNWGSYSKCWPSAFNSILDFLFLAFERKMDTIIAGSVFEHIFIWRESGLFSKNLPSNQSVQSVSKLKNIIYGFLSSLGCNCSDLFFGHINRYLFFRSDSTQNPRRPIFIYDTYMLYHEVQETFNNWSTLTVVLLIMFLFLWFVILKNYGDMPPRAVSWGWSNSISIQRNLMIWAIKRNPNIWSVVLHLCWWHFVWIYI